MFTAALFKTAKTRKQPKCPRMDKWIKKMWNVYTRGSYSAVRRNKTLPLATMWMYPEDIRSEISQTEQDKYRMISLTRGIERTKQKRNKEK